jgi:hypothetical protein
MRKLTRGVAGILRAGEIRRVTRVTRLRQADILAVGMAKLAANGGMTAGERKRAGGMIVRGRLPANGTVARSAIVRQQSGDVIRTLSRIEVHGVTRIAVGGGLGIRTGHVTLRAGDVRMRAGQRESSRRVIVARGPVRGRVARFTGRRESGRSMVRVMSARVIGLVTLAALRRDAARVLTIDVALLAIHGRMSACQREGRLRMVERGGLPSGLSVTSLTGLRKLSGGMTGTLRAGEIRLMTGSAGRRHVLILSVDVTLLAIHGRVSAGQWEDRRRMIECGGLPDNRGVARGAVVGQLTRRMAGGLCSRVVRLMTRIAVGSGILVLPVQMALLTTHGGMRARQRERSQGVIHGGRLPGRGGMACRALVREDACDVIGVRGRSEIGLVA